MLSKMCRMNSYAVAVLSVFVATVLTQLFYPLLASVSFTLFYAAIAITAWVGGARPGLLAIVLSLLSSNYFVLPPVHSLAIAEPDKLIRLGLIAFVSFLISHLISELRSAQYQLQQLSDRRLQESEEQLRLALQAAHMGMWNWNLVTGEIVWTPEHEQLLGMAPGTFDGRYETFDARLHPDDREGLNQAVETAIQERQIYKHEYRVIWADGTIHWVEGRGQTFYDETGQPFRMTGTLMNIDDRKQLEIALKQSEQQFRAIFEAEPECVKIVTAEGILHNMNPAGLAMIEVDSLEQVQGECICALIEPEHQQAFLEFTQQVAQGKTATLEFEVTGIKGTRRWLESHAVPLQISNEPGSLVLAVTRDITAQKQAKEIIQRSEERYRSLVTATFQIVWTTDADGNTTSVSPVWFDLTGQTWDDLHQWGWVDYLHPDDRDRAIAVWKQAVATQSTYNIEYRLRAKDGNYRDFRVRGVPVKNLDNSIREWVGTLTDITEQKQAEIALRESEEKLRLLIQHAPASIAMFDREMRYISASQQWVDDYKLGSIHALISRSHYEIFPEIPERWRQIHQRCLAGAIEKCDDDLFVRADGRQQWVSWKARPWYTAAGDIDGIIIFAVDVTQRKQAELDLQQYKDIFQFAEHGLAISRGTQLENVNPAFARMHGYSVEEMVNKPILDLFPTEYHTETIAFIERLNDVGHLTHESNHLRKDGTAFPILLDITLVRDQQGNPSYQIVTALDITEHKQAEAEVKRLNAELEQRIAERTAELQKTNSLLNNFFNAASSAGIGLCIHDQDLRFIQINEALATINGPSVEAHLGKTTAELLPELAPIVTPLHQHVLTTGQPIIDLEVATEAPSQPGEKRYWSASYFPIVESGSSTATVGVGVIVAEISDRKRAEMALQQSERKFRAIFEQTFQFIALLTTDGTVLEINQSPLDFAQINREAVIGQPMWEFPSWSASIKTQEIGKTAVAQAAFGKFYRSEVTVLGANQNYATFDFSVKPVLDEAGQVVLLIAEGRDISDRKRAEEALEKELMRSKALFKASLDGIVVLNRQGYVVDANDSFAQMLGYRLEETLNLHVVDWDAQWTREELTQIIQSSQFVGTSFETLHRRRDGSLYEVEVTVSDVKLGDDVLQLCICRDISERQATLRERKRAEAILQESDRRWRFLLDNVQLIVVGLDQNGNVEYINPFFLQLTGYTEKEVLGKYWFGHFLPSSQKPNVEICFQELLEKDFHPHYQNSIVTKLGEERMIAWSNTLLKNTEGQAIGTISFGEDITERYTLELMKAEFISIVSHELRTPLTSISGALELLSTGLVQPESDRGQETIAIAATEADRLTRLVNDILDLERLESGKIRLECQPCDVAQLMTRAVDFMQLTASQSAITLSVEPLSIILNIDGDRILQVLTNLLSNAVKFSPKHSTIWLTAQIYAEEQQVSEVAESSTHRSQHLALISTPCVLITVRDQGRGIPVSKLESIFERFQQVDASDSRKKGGTGLGLAICRSIVQQHGGMIWAESVLEQGSSFHFTLPITNDV